MMDLNDDLCRTDFFDFVKLDSGANGLTPVAFIDSVLDYTQTDGNNNLSATGGQIKTILDEMLMSDTLGTNPDPLQSNQGSLELLGSMHWPSSGHLDNSLAPTTNVSSDPSPNWLLSSATPTDGEVTTLTNLLDPLFVSYDDTKMDQYFSSASSSDLSNPGAISSDLITTTFMNDSSASPTTSSETDLISWQKSSDVFCDESLLRSSLQAGNNNKTSQQVQIPTTVMAVTQKLQQSQPGTNGMTELRKVLSFPPLSNGNGQVTLASTNSSVVSTGSPTSSDQIMTSDPSNGGVGDLGGDGQYYELKVLDSVFVDPDTVIPNVEELIMTRITPQFNGTSNGIKKGIEISEKKINSTTLSAKWTYTTNNDQNKTPRKRNKKNGLKNPNFNGTINGVLPSTLNCDNQRNGAVSSMSPSVNSPKSSQSSPNSNSTSNGNGTTGATSRKERSLHYCNICCKGFKDKYSVNVHVRTHTGEKPFACTLCGKNFRQKAHLAKHYQTHAAKANNPHGKGSAKRTVTVAAT